MKENMMSKQSADDYDLTRNDEVYNRVLQVSVLFYWT